MRNQPAALTAALANVPATGVSSRKAAWIVAKNRETGAPEEVGLWTGDDDANLTVIRGADNVTVTRPYLGGGNLLKVSDIPRVSDLTAQTVTIDLSQIADAVQLLLRTYDVHRAQVEIHEIVLSPETGQPVAPDLPIFLGMVDGAPIKTPRVGEQGRATLKCVSEMMMMLRRTNPEKASYEAQLLRDGDEWNLYAGVVETWELSWGQ
ncbi:hypothetical protein [Neorhizobium petrolearium]|uniref:hypothetical protein n=1 Tax=Neorhizobium petrolearium TaxID=515361 RepID=UPI003F80FE9D